MITRSFTVLVDFVMSNHDSKSSFLMKNTQGTFIYHSLLYHKIRAKQTLGARLTPKPFLIFELDTNTYVSFLLFLGPASIYFFISAW